MHSPYPFITKNSTKKKQFSHFNFHWCNRSVWSLSLNKSYKIFANHARRCFVAGIVMVRTVRDLITTIVHKDKKIHNGSLSAPARATKFIILKSRRDSSQQSRTMLLNNRQVSQLIKGCQCCCVNLLSKLNWFRSNLLNIIVRFMLIVCRCSWPLCFASPTCRRIFSTILPRVFSTARAVATISMA